MERPRIFLETKTTNSLSWVNLLNVEITTDAKGVSYLEMSISPDPYARYQVVISRILNVSDVELLEIWIMTLPHLTSGVYEGIRTGDHIIVNHRTVDSAITVKSGVSLELSEVIGEMAREAS